MQQLASALDPAWALTVLLLSVRVATVLLFTPLLYAVSMPPTVRLLVIAGLACVIALPFGSTAAAVAQDMGAVVQAVVREAAIGATLGLGILMAFAGFALAGHLIDVQIGFGMAHILDPLTRVRLPVLSAAFGLFAAVFFFVVDGHHIVLRGLAFSVERFPVGMDAASPAHAAGPVVRQMALLFSLGFALAAPVVLGLLLVDFALGVVFRNLPQMNMLVIGIPVKIVVGLLALTVWATTFSAPAHRLYAAIYQAWTGWFDAQGQR